MTERPVGIVGCEGSVGRAVAQHLAGTSLMRASRRPGPGVDLAFDARDSEQVAQFAARCSVVVSCLPAALGPAVARAAVARGAHGVDVGHLRSPGSADRGAICEAGAWPGVTGALAVALAGGMDRVSRIRCAVGGRDRLTTTAARDFLEPGDFGSPRRALVAGAPVVRGPGPVSMNAFPMGVVGLPFLSRETLCVAADLGCPDVDFAAVIDGPMTERALRRGATAEALAEASRVDSLGARRYYRVAMAVDGGEAGRPVRRTAVIDAGSGAELTGAFAALVVRAVLEGPPISGSLYARQVVAPAGLLDALAGSAAVRSVRRDVDLDRWEEGSL